MRIIKITMMIIIGLLLSCSDEIKFHSFEEQRVNEMLLTAKEIVQNQGNSVSIPVNMGSMGSRSGLSILAEATPQWDIVKYFTIDGLSSGGKDRMID